MIQGVYENFLESLSEACDDQDLVRSAGLLLEVLGVDAFAYLCYQSSGQRQPRLVSNYPIDWTSLYLDRRYEAIDPVIVYSRTFREPLRWGRLFDQDANTEIQMQLFSEAAEFGIRSGLTIPIHDRRGNIAAMTFAASEDRPLLLRRADRYERALQLVATTFHIHARRMHSSNLVVDGVQLTRREYECLQWAAKGKSAWEIGQILGITRRTVSFHLDNTRYKLGVRTLAQAVVRLAASNNLSK